MGFIKRNKYTFEIYLTDKGREAFINNGFKNEIKYFSLIDNSNYNQMSGVDPNVLTGQTIPTIKFYDTTEVNNTIEVYTQDSKRGSVDNNILFTHGFLGVNQRAENNYIAYDPDLSTETIKIVTYKD
jgi:hypothetical protein